MESQPWQIGAEAALRLSVDPVYVGQVISLTLLAPGAALSTTFPTSTTVEANASFGLAGVQLTWLPPDQQEMEIALAAAAGARYIGLDFDWQRIEPESGKYLWEKLDRVVELARQHRLVLVPMLLFTPRWASSVPFAPLDFHRAPPSRLKDYREFVYAVVNRYRPYGESPLTADGYGIRDWVIWNEPNMHSPGEHPEPGKFWLGSLEEYILLLRAGYEGAHAADPGCNVLNGALTDIFWTEDGSDVLTSLIRFYDPNGDGNTADGARPFFDTLNIHLYQLDAPDAAWYQERLSRLIAIAQRFGDGGKPIWITETGYGTVSRMPEREAPGFSPYISEAAQADAVALVYDNILAYPESTKVFWWSLRDYYSDNSFRNEAMEAHYGLLHENFYPKPAYVAYAQRTGFVGQALTLAAQVDAQGTAQVNVPATFIEHAGSYLVLAQLREDLLATLAVYEVSETP